MHYKWTSYVNNIMAQTEIETLLSLSIRNRKMVFPSPFKSDIFHALDFFPPEETRAVILGHDPYPTPGMATGLAFGINPGEKIPPTLRNIIGEVRRDTGLTVTDLSLESWARQGVLLINKYLTTGGRSGDHRHWGWDVVVGRILEVVSARSRHSVSFLLWGRGAEKLADAHVSWDRHWDFRTSHPAPLTVNRGFHGCGHFSKVNDLLPSEEKISWGEEVNHD